MFKLEVRLVVINLPLKSGGRIDREIHCHPDFPCSGLLPFRPTSIR